MKNVLSLGALLTLAANNVSGHYIFNRIDIGGVKGGEFEGIRRNTNYNSPVVDLASPNLRCNEGGLVGSQTSVRSAKAGDSFTFYLDTAVYHQGPVSVFVSKAPGSVQSYQGDGSWSKIAELGPTFSGNSATWPMAQSYTFKLPTCLPDGEYLLRISQLGIHNPWPGGVPQFYTSCAQVKVTGGTNTGNFKANLKIPGAFSQSDSGYTANIYNGLTSYTVPGGPVSTC
jgi:hypothetical protein